MRLKKLLFPSVLFLPCALLCFILPAYAADFYVDNSGSPACNDSASNGSEAAPWCTITFGVGQISGSDTLFVKTGTYAESFTIGSGASGSPGNPTLVSAAPGHTPTIDNNSGGRVKILGVSYLIFDGFVITDMNQGLFVENSNNITVRNNTVHNIEQEGIRVKVNSFDIIVENNVVHNTGTNAFNGEGIYIGTGSGGPLDNTNNVTVRGNIIHDTDDEGIELKPGTHDCIVEGNTLFNIATGSNSIGSIEVNQAMSGAQSWGVNPNHVIRNNIVHNSDTAIRLGTGSTAYNNLIYNPTAGHHGILVNNIAGDTYTRVIYHNTIDVASSDAVVITAGTADVRNNIGPATTDNIATSDTYYVNKAGADYHLVSGSAAVNAGLDLAATVPTDIEGNSRTANPPPDLGAYEIVSGARPDPPTNLGAIVR